MPEIESVSLRRGACYGPCPIYQVTLCRDGRATWHGDTFSQRLGDYRGEVFEEDFVKLARFIEQSGFFGWADRYQVDVTDNPEYELEVHRGEEKKRVLQDATDEPRDFWTIATLIDGLCFGIEWIPEVNDSRPT